MSMVKGGLFDRLKQFIHIEQVEQYLRQEEQVYTILVPAEH